MLPQKAFKNIWWNSGNNEPRLILNLNTIVQISHRHHLNPWEFFVISSPRCLTLMEDAHVGVV